MKGMVTLAVLSVAVVLAPWILSRLGRRFGSNDMPIKPPVQKFSGADESLPQIAALRRRAAESLQKQARAVASGQVTPSVAAGEETRVIVTDADDTTPPPRRSWVQ